MFSGMDLKLWIFLFTITICKYGQCQDVTLHQHPTVNVTEGDTFTLWCNVTGTLSTPDGYQVTWKKSNSNMTIDQWCYGTARPNERLQNKECKRNDTTFFNVSDEYAYGLHIKSAGTEDIGKYTCSFAVVFGSITQSDEETDVFVKEKVQTIPTATTEPIQSTETPERRSTTTTTVKITQTTAKGSGTKATDSPNNMGLSKETIIAIGAGGGAGVLLVMIIVAVVCVKKKGKGNSTLDIDERKSTYRKSNSFEKNTENADDKRKSNPLEKNVENLHYADLALHDNPKSSSSKGTGSAKTKTLTVNPSDDRVEYAAVMAS